MTPTQRSLALLKSRGYLCAIVEHWNSYVKIRQDLFGFADILAVHENTVFLVQTTTGDNVSKRVEKIRSTAAAKLWWLPPTRLIVVHGWRKVGARGKRKLWECREVGVNPWETSNDTDPDNPLPHRDRPGVVRGDEREMPTER